MRNLTPEMLTYLTNNVTSFKLCWEIRRKDGVSLYYTEYDQDLIIDGNTYKKRDSGTGNSLRFSDMLKGSDSNIDMILTEADGITLEDLYAFKYDAADIFVFLVRTDDLTDKIKLINGLLGATEILNGEATINYKSFSDLLNKKIGRDFSPECDAELFDSYCLADTAGRQFFDQSPTGVDPTKPFTVFTDTNLAQVDGYFDNGYIQWTNGSNQGVETKVKTYVADVITLALGMPNAIDPSDEYTIYAGCDKQISTCKNKFNNVRNFKGFPSVPNGDEVSKYT